MLLHNINITAAAYNCLYQQKVILHAVMAKMALIIYGKVGKRNTENDYVKFVVDVRADFASDNNTIDADTNLTIAQHP